MGKTTTRSAQVDTVEHESKIGAVQLESTGALGHAIEDLKASMFPWCQDSCGLPSINPPPLSV